MDIHDATNDNTIYGFCALEAPGDLTHIWFGRPQGTPPPAAVYVTLTDRRTGQVVRSNTVTIAAE